MLAEKGFQAISVQDITGKAGINRTTFYLHFPDKYALLDYSVSQLFRQELDKRTLDVCSGAGPACLAGIRYKHR